MKTAPIFAFLLVTAVAAFGAGGSRTIGDFETAVDVGKVNHAGTATFANGVYRITGSGANMWAREDAFHFLSRPAAGDIVLVAELTWEGAGKEPHRKGGVMVRQGLDADAPYVDIAVHGEGLIALQYRRAKGAITESVRTPIRPPVTIKLEKTGDVFTASVAKPGQAFQPIGAIEIPLAEPLRAGLAVCAHNAANEETALFRNVEVTTRDVPAGAKRVRESSLEILDVDTGERQVVYRDRSMFEAPNWSRDGRTLIINRAGGIYAVPVVGGEPRRVPTGGIDRCNNDHGLSFDGKWLAVSAGGGKEGSRVYVVPATGGDARLVTPIGPSYWHGWSPDGATLIYTGRRDENFDIYAIPTAGGVERRLTDAAGLDDGSEFTADGSKIYFNSERTGVMQIWRMNPDGSGQEQVTKDPAFADWFPHPSPDGKWLVWLSYDGGVAGHPPDKNVTLRLMPLAGGAPKVIATLFGGQGTMNVPSWSPDSKRIAFVSYRNVP